MLIAEHREDWDLAADSWDLTALALSRSQWSVTYKQTHMRTHTHTHTEDGLSFPPGILSAS